MPKSESFAGMITRTFEVDATVDRTFEAFTNKKDLEMWMADHYEIDAKKGGRFTMSNTEEAIVITGEFLEVGPNSKLVFTWVLNEYDPKTKTFGPSSIQENPTKVTVRFEKRPRKGTRIVLVHEGFPERDENFHGSAAGWDLMIGEDLKAYLEKSPEAYETWSRESKSTWNDRWKELIRKQASSTTKE